MKLLVVINVDWFLISHRLPVLYAAHDSGYEVHIATTITNSNNYDTLNSYGFHLHQINVDRSAKNILSPLTTFFSLFRFSKPLILIFYI